jgi:hypothetical protein
MIFLATALLAGCTAAAPFYDTEAYDCMKFPGGSCRDLSFQGTRADQPVSLTDAYERAETRAILVPSQPNIAAAQQLRHELFIVQNSSAKEAQ